MAKLFPRAAATVALLGALLVTAACDDPGPAAAVPVTPNPSPGDPVPSIFLLRTDQMRGYTRTAARSLTPQIVANDASDPSLVKTLTDQGYKVGAEFTFQQPQPPIGLPFGQVVSQATIFADSAGAARNVESEKTRENQPPGNGGTIAPVTDLQPSGVESLTVYVTISTDGAATAQSYLAIMRKGRVVAELFAGGDPTTSTEKNFAALLLLQEQMLAGAPS